MLNNSQLGPGGSLAIKVFPGVPDRELSLREMIHFGTPSLAADKVVNAWRRKNLPNFWRGYWRIAAARAIGVPHFYGQLHLRVFRKEGAIEDLGLASLRVVTDAGVQYLVDAFQASGGALVSNFKYHGFGSSLTPAEAQTQTALTTEFTTQYAGDVRPTGTQTQVAENVYRTVATFSPDQGPISCAEHGLFSAVSGPVLWDRSAFTAVGLTVGDSLAATYDCTFNAGN